MHNSQSTNDAAAAADVVAAAADVAPLLPRSAWDSQLVKLRVTLQAKKSLDRQESDPYK